MTLRARLLIVIALLMFTYVATAFIVVSTQRNLLIGQVDRRIRSLPPNALTSPGGPVTVPEPEGQGTQSSAPPESPFSDLYVGYVDASGASINLVIGSLLDSMPDLPAAVAASAGRFEIVTIKSTDSSVRFRAIVMPQVAENTFIVAAQPLTETDAAIARLKRTLAFAGAVIAIVLATAFFWVQRLGLRPIARVTNAAEAIAAGDRAHRVDVANAHTEAGKLGLAFNVMLDERDADETRLRQFVADASHELRTPLTSVRGYLELYRQGAFREPHQLDDVVRRLSSEAARMHGLVEDLLSLASLDEGRPLRHEPVDLIQVANDLAQDARATQPDRSIEVDSTLSMALVTGDPSLLVQLGSILVTNALTHTPPSTPVTLRIREEKAGFALIIADKGPGLDAESAEHVFDRFWRGESGRSRARGAGAGGSRGAGLGLSIAQSIVELHKGTITLETAPGNGCTFTVKLPVDASA